MAKKCGNREGSITRRKKSGLYMARYTVQTATAPKRKTLYGRRVEKWMRSSQRPRQTRMVG